MLNPFVKLARAIRERGIKGTFTQIYLIGDLKFGVLKGTDKFGNKYYEDLELPFGQHRWVEYSNIDNPDASMIQPDWHGWMHHVYDEVPAEVSLDFRDRRKEITQVTHAIFPNHVSNATFDSQTEQVDTSQYRQRGYRVGSLMTGPDDPDNYYLQPGHPLSPKVDKGGRFKSLKGVNYADITSNDMHYPKKVDKMGLQKTSRIVAQTRAIDETTRKLMLSRKAREAAKAAAEAAAAAAAGAATPEVK